MFKKILLLVLVALSLAGCVDETSVSSYSYRPPTSIITPINYISITKSNFFQYFSISAATPDNSDCIYAGCKMPANYSFSVSKKSNFKFESSVLFFYSGKAKVTFFNANGGLTDTSGSFNGSLSMTGTSLSFSENFTINAFCTTCKSNTVRVSNLSWDISTISGRIYY